MAQSEIKVVEMVRRIRDRNHELLKDKTPEERTAFYEAKAKRRWSHSGSPRGLPRGAPGRPRHFE